ncbi:MAG: DegV family protein [Oscillospiraceae bacterium]|nr:DegV family protein [Oscillospiraceae bacterium]
MFRIVTDTSSNLPTAYLQAENITVIPFTFHTESGEQSCMDTASFDAKAFYTAMRNGEKVTTSQIPPQRFVDNIRPMLENGEDVLFVSMSSGISGSYASSKIAANQLAEEFPERKILTVDTYSASLAEGIVVMRAVECRKEGLSIDETYQILRALRHRIAQIFTVGDLRYLKRTGRLSNLEAAVGTVLQIKPLLKGDPQGKIVCFAKVRGRQRAIEEMAKRYEELVVSPETQTVCISHADCEADAQILASMLRRSKPPKDILIVDYEPVTGSHVGPGALALFFVSDDNVRNI